MSAKQFFKSTTFKCLVTLLCILLVSGIFLTISYGFLEVTEGERLQRAISKIYSGQEVEIYGKDGKLITKQDKNPESLIGETVTVDNAEISQMYKIVTGGETDYLVQSLGKGGYGGGSVTCWVALNVSETKINSVRKVSVATNKGQSFIGKITGGFLESFTNGYFDGVYYSTDEGYLSSGATMSSNAICNSVNGAITYVNENIFKNVEINKKLELEQSEKILNCFKSYCIENPAHKSFKEEWEIIKNFYNYIDKLLKDGNNKWLL